MGCGRVGASLAVNLDHLGHHVVVVDQSKDAFLRLPSSFGGRTVTGRGHDKQVLDKCDITRADAFAAVSSGDNSNIIAARVCRETFAVPTVVARIYDERRAAVFERLGICTIATVPWASSQFLKHLIGDDEPIGWTDSTGTVSLKTSLVPVSWVGKTIDSIQLSLDLRVAAITREGRCFIPTATDRFHDADRAHIALATHDAALLDFSHTQR